MPLLVSRTQANFAPAPNRCSDYKRLIQTISGCIRHLVWLWQVSIIVRLSKLGVHEIYNPKGLGYKEDENFQLVILLQQSNKCIMSGKHQQVKVIIMDDDKGWYIAIEIVYHLV